MLYDRRENGLSTWKVVSEYKHRLFSQEGDWESTKNGTTLLRGRRRYVFDTIRCGGLCPSPADGEK